MPNSSNAKKVSKNGGGGEARKISTTSVGGGGSNNDGGESTAKTGTTTTNNNSNAPGVAFRSKACSNCQKDHVGCGGERPCARCVKRGWADNCEDAVYKKRGRKRPTGENGEKLEDTGNILLKYLEDVIDQPSKLAKKMEKAISEGPPAKETGIDETPLAEDGRTMLHLDHKQMNSLAAIDNQVRSTVDTLYSNFFKIQAHVVKRIESGPNVEKNLELMRKINTFNLTTANARTSVAVGNAIHNKDILMMQHMRDLSKAFVLVETPTLVQTNFARPIFVNRSFAELTGISQTRWLSGELYTVDAFPVDSMMEYLGRHMRNMKSDDRITYMKLNVTNKNVEGEVIPCILMVSYITHLNDLDPMGQVLQFVPLNGMP